MLSSPSIPQYQDRPEQWQRFFDKAAKGSCKAHEILIQADMAYMIELTGDVESPNSLRLEDYQMLFCDRFPKVPPAETPQCLFDLGLERGWFALSLRIESERGLEKPADKGLWSRRVRVSTSSLLNNSIVFCFNEWSLANYFAALAEDPLEYDALLVTAGMLYLSFTWPSSRTYV